MNRDSKSEAPLKERLRAETRRAILRAAEALLTEHGVAGARMEDIAARAGVSVGTVYNHVGDRKTLLDVLLEAQREELVGRIDEVLEGAADAPFERTLEQFVAAVFKHFDAHIALYRIVIEEELLRSREGKKSSAMQVVAERTDKLTRIGVDRGALRAEDAAHYSAWLLGAIRGVLAMALRTQSTAQVSELVGPTTRFFLDGARRRS